MADLLLDVNVDTDLVRRFETQGRRTYHTRLKGLQKAADPNLLMYAARHHYTFITHDQGFIDLHTAWMLWSAEWEVTREHAGILIITPMAVDHLEQHLWRALNQDIPQPNELYQWTTGAGWAQRRPPLPIID